MRCVRVGKRLFGDDDFQTDVLSPALTERPPEIAGGVAKAAVGSIF